MSKHISKLSWFNISGILLLLQTSVTAFVPRTRTMRCCSISNNCNNIYGRLNLNGSYFQPISSIHPTTATSSPLNISSNLISTFHLEDDIMNSQCCRRRIMMLFTMTVPWMSMVASPKDANARGLVQFPCPRLANTYHFLRVGNTLLEEEGMFSTNPLFLTNRDDALSDAGQEQILDACRKLKTDIPTIVKFSLSAAAIDTANLVGRELGLGGDRLIPEFTFLDPRGLGNWDMSAKSQTLPAVFAMDTDEAGIDGVGGRPPPNDDGTPHEVLADQAVRLRQLLSVLESQSSGETYLLVFPDGTGPALLSCMVAGIPYNRVHEIEFAPGELRMNVTLGSAQALWKHKQEEEAKAYRKLLEQGRINLRELRSQGENVVNLKDQKLENERIALDQIMEEKYRSQELASQKEKQARLGRQKTVEAQLREDSIVVSASNLLAPGAGLALIGAILMGGNREVAPESIHNDMEESSSQEGLQLQSSNSEDSLPLNDYLQPSMVAQNISLYNEPATMDPKEAARQAMEDYMNRDDGASDWLMSLNDILIEAKSEDDEMEETVMQKSEQNEQASRNSTTDDRPFQ